LMTIGGGQIQSVDLLQLGDLCQGRRAERLLAFEGMQAFSAPTLAQIAELKKIYGLDLTAADSHQLVESERAVARATTKRPAATAKRRSGRNRS